MIGSGLASTVAAARAAEAETLWEEAARLYEQALALLPDAGGADDGDEARLLTSLGACYWNMSDARAAWRTLRRAMSLYQQRGDGVGLARATVEILRIWGPPERQRAMAEAALDALAGDEPRLRAELLLRMRRVDEALAIADAHGYEDMQTLRVERDAWSAWDEGRIEDAVEGCLRAFEVYDRHRLFHVAAGMRRVAGFNVLAAGRLDEGDRLAGECVEYSRRVHLRFTEQLAIMDRAGVRFARADFGGCLALVGQAPTATDFRG